MLAVIGLGYVGITSLLCFKSLGVEVIGYDNNPEVLNKLKNGELNIADDKLQTALQTYYQDIDFCADVDKLQDAEEVLICVPTDGHNGSLDLSIVMSVLEMLKSTNVKTVWIRSTIDNPNLFDQFKDYPFAVNSYPEFLREGKCWDDFYSPPLIVLGQEETHKTIIHDTLAKQFGSVNVATPKEALTLKLFCNAFHALKVAFANEVSNVSWSQDIDVSHVMNIFCTDDKLNLSKYYLKPGLPYGGPCLPKDTAALANSMQMNDGQTLLHAVIEQNERHKHKYAEKLLALASGTIGFYGYEFKVGTGDVRNSPLLDVAKIVSQYRKIYICDEPHAHTQHSQYDIKSTDNITHIKTLSELEGLCDIIVTEHDVTGENIMHWKAI